MLNLFQFDLNHVVNIHPKSIQVGTLAQKFILMNILIQCFDFNIILPLLQGSMQLSIYRILRHIPEALLLSVYALNTIITSSRIYSSVYALCSQILQEY